MEKLNFEEKQENPSIFVSCFLQELNWELLNKQGSSENPNVRNSTGHLGRIGSIVPEVPRGVPIGSIVPVLYILGFQGVPDIWGE